MPTRITETTRATALRRPLTPFVIQDSDVPGLALHVTSKRGFWAFSYTPHGFNPSTGKRWGSTRLELGDAMLVPVAEARGAALAAKSAVRAGRDPHRERLASTASSVAQRSILPQTVAEALDQYDRAIMTRGQISEAYRRQAAHYARKACTLMNVLALPLAAIEARIIRLMVDTMHSSAAERRHVFGGLNRFLGWCRRQGLVAANACADLDRIERPKPSRGRDNVPSLAVLKSIWSAVEGEPQRDLVRFMLLVPLRRNEAAGLRWREVDLDQGHLCVAADRMKSREVHQLPLSKAALAILKERRAYPGVVVFPAADDKPFVGWTRLIGRIRKRIGQGEARKKEAFSFQARVREPSRWQSRRRRARSGSCPQARGCLRNLSEIA
jgi:integrase